MSGIMFYGHNGRIEIPLYTGKLITLFIFIVNGFKIFLIILKCEKMFVQT